MSRLHQSARQSEGQARATAEFTQRQTKRFSDNLRSWPIERSQALFAAFDKSADYARAKLLVSKGWEQAGLGAFSMLKAWVLKERPEDFQDLLPNPEDRSLEAYLVWRIDGADSDDL